MTCRKFVLASKSPRRREILASLGWPLETLDIAIDESAVYAESPKKMAHRLAEEKAAAGSVHANGLWTIGADTVVDVDGIALGKPVDRADAAAMLHMLSDREHLVHTGIAIAANGLLLASDVVTTRVWFGKLTEEEIGRFLETGMADDKAGAYAIQGAGAVLVEKIDGCYYNVVGLPVFRLNEMIKMLENRTI